MVWWSKKGEKDNSRPSQALVRQDPRTSVKTTSASTETTNTAVQNSTITDNNKQTVTFMSTRQTVTHTQRALITETTTRRTPSQAELEALFAQMRMGGEGATGTTTTTTTVTSRSRPPSLNGLSFRSTQPFKATASSAGKRSSTLVKTEQTTVTKKNGLNVTQHLETHRVDLKGKPAWTPFPSNVSSSGSTYVSPYAKKPTLAITGSSPIATVSSPPSIPKTTPSAFESFFKTTSKPTVKPLTSTAVPRPYVSLGSSASSTKAKPTFSGLDAQGSVSSIGAASSQSSLAKSKLKPARVYIFNNERFDTQNEFRMGSAHDVKALRSTFERLKCKVEVITDATLATVKRTVKTLETKDFGEKSALVLVFLSHGTRHDRLAAKDSDYSLDYDVVFPILRNRTLKDKPKLLFVQACKGANELGGFMTDAAQPNGSPNEILKCYSTYEGYVSYRTEDGTPFIQTLCEALDKSGRTSDIDAIMTNVRRVVKSQTKDGQIPSVTSTLTSKGRKIRVLFPNEILDYDVVFPILRNRTLKDKPKLLFVQACKGANELGGFMTDAAQPNGSPNEILKCYSTYEGYVSYRTEDGTPFIQTLCEALDKSGKTSDIDAIMTNVRRVVKSQTKDGQIPSVTSTLTSKYVFGDYI